MADSCKKNGGGAWGERDRGEESVSRLLTSRPRSFLLRDPKCGGNAPSNRQSVCLVSRGGAGSLSSQLSDNSLGSREHYTRVRELGR